MVNFLTFDIEDWFHVLDCAQTQPESKWRYFAPRVEHNTLRLLEILDQYHCRATFFVLGWIAERFPDLIREIDQRGHEIGSHGYNHLELQAMDNDSLRRDISRALDRLTPLSSKPILGYRAPGFSFAQGNLDFPELLLSLGFEYDSSYFPARYQDSSRGDLPTHAALITCKSGKSLLEIPATPVRMGKLELYGFGGGYFRMTPLTLIRAGIRQLNRQNQAALVYLHPREIDPAQPRLSLPLTRRWKTYLNLHRTEAKLCAMLEEFRFDSIAAHYQLSAWSSPDLTQDCSAIDLTGSNRAF